ncbi:MAG: putative LysR-family regulator [Frankiales bacterium]|nr:putative LysR-family regulator [Frankiales bacterium]
MTLDPRRLLVLHAVDRHGSVQAAAERLHLTPSAVSQQLSKLEAETGVALLDRTRLGGGRSIGLTAAGRALAAHADVLAAALGEAEQTLSALRGGPVGAVTIGAFPTAIERLVAPAVAHLALVQPGLRPRVVEVSEPAALTDLAAGRLDLAVLEHDGEAGDRMTTGIVERPLMRDAYRIVVPHAWAGRSDTDVLAGPWIAGPPDSAARAALDRLVTGAGRTRGDVAHECLEFTAALSLVGAGLGAALVPELALRQFQHAHALVHRGELDAGARVLTVAHCAGRNQPSAAIDAVVTALRRQAGSQPGKG